MPMDASRLEQQLVAAVDKPALAGRIVQRMREAGDGKVGTDLWGLIVDELVNTLAAAWAPKVVEEVRQGTVTTTVEVGGLQTFTAPPAGPAPTTPPVAPVDLTGSIQ